MHSYSGKAAAAMSASMLIFGTIGLFRRLIPLPSEVLACTRGILGGIFLYLLLRAKGRRMDLAAVKKRLLPLAVTGALIGLNWILLFEAYNYTTIAAATLAYYMEPPLVILASPFFLHERITARKGLCICVAAAGMVLVSGILENGTAGKDSLLGIGLGLGAAALYASVVILNKKVTGIPIYEKTILQLVSAGAVLIPYLIAAGSFHAYQLNAIQALCLILVCVIHTGVAYALYFGAIERLPGQTAAILSYIDPVTAVLLSALFLHEPMSMQGVCGAVMIIGSAIMSERQSHAG